MSHIEKMKNVPAYAEGYLYALQWSHLLNSDALRREIECVESVMAGQMRGDES